MTDKARVPASGVRDRIAARAIVDDYLSRIQRGEVVSAEEIISSHPRLSQHLRVEFERLVTIEKRRKETESSGRISVDISNEDTIVRCPHCHAPSRFSAMQGPTRCEVCGDTYSLIQDLGDDNLLGGMKRIGRFELVEKLGSGAFSVVWKAWDDDLQRFVALKIPSDRSDDILQDARASSGLRHPNIVHIHEIGVHEDRIYIVRDLIDGSPLSALIDKGGFTVQESVTFCEKIARALHHAHRIGVVHRDLKPQNVILRKDGEPIIIDFGLARRSATDTTVSLRSNGEIVGTIGYMSPEQAAGRSHEADARSDIYSLGVLLYKLLTRELPFRGSPQVVLEKIIHEEAPGPRKLCLRVPIDLDTICLKCLEKDPNRRFEDAEQLAAELERFRLGLPIQSRRIGLVSRFWRACRRRPTIAALSMAFVASLLLGTVLSTHFALQATRREAERTEALAEALVGKIQSLRQARPQGYRDEAWEIIRQTLQLNAKTVTTDRLRREAVGVMGDFVGLPPVTLSGFPADVSAIAIHPEGEVLAVGLEDGSIQLFEPGSGVPLQRLPTVHEQVAGLAFREDGGLISVGERPGADVVIWTRQTDRQWRMRDACDTPAPAQLVRFTDDGSRMAAQVDQEIQVWNLQTAEAITVYRLEESELCRGLALSPSGSLLALALRDAVGQVSLDVYDVASRVRQARIVLDFGFPSQNSMCFSPDGTLFAYGAEPALILFDAATLQRRWMRQSDAHKAISFSRDGQFLSTVDLRGNVTIRGVSTGEELARLTHRCRQQGSQALTYSANGSFLASANVESVQAWHVEGASERQALAGHSKPVPVVAFSSSGSTLATGSKDHTVRLWNPVSERQIWQPPAFPGVVQCLAFSRDERLLATACWTDNPTINIWSMESRREIAQISHELADVNSMVFLGGNNRLAAAGDGGIAVWSYDKPEAEEFEFELTFSMAAGERCRAIAGSSDGRLIAWVDDAQIHAYDTHALQALKITAPPMLQGWHGLAFRAESSLLVYINRLGKAQIWDIENDRAAGSIGEDNHFQGPHIAVSRDGRWLAALAQTDTISICDLQNQREIFSLRPERAAVWSLAWSPDFQRLAVGLSDGGLAIWDLKQVKAELEGLSLGW